MSRILRGIPKILLFYPLDVCATFKCANHSRCEISKGQPQCVCRDVRECPAGQQSVCGSDGSTYISRCHLDVENCEKKTGVTVVKQGPCGKSF